MADSSPARRRSFPEPQDNGAAVKIRDTAEEDVAVGDIVNTGPVKLDAEYGPDHGVLFNATLADDPDGADCIFIDGSARFTVAQSRRTSTRLQHLADIAEQWRAAKGFRS